MVRPSVTRRCMGSVTPQCICRFPRLIKISKLLTWTLVLINHRNTATDQESLVWANKDLRGVPVVNMKEKQRQNEQYVRWITKSNGNKTMNLSKRITLPRRLKWKRSMSKHKLLCKVRCKSSWSPLRKTLILVKTTHFKHYLSKIKSQPQKVDQIHVVNHKSKETPHTCFNHSETPQGLLTRAKRKAMLTTIGEQRTTGSYQKMYEMPLTAPR